jgi:hypothetical protein
MDEGLTTKLNHGVLLYAIEEVGENVENAINIT